MIKIKFLIALFCFVSISVPTAYAGGKLKQDMKACLANADIKAKGAAEIKSKEVIGKQDKGSALTGAGAGLGCVLFSIAVLGLDGGTLAAACAIATAGGAIAHHSITTDEYSKEAIQIYKQVFDEEQKSEYAKCALNYAG